MQMHPRVQFGSITGSERCEWEAQPGVFDQPPETGHIDRELLDPLASVLARHTGTPTTCWFAVWEGFAGLPADVQAAPTFSVPARTYHLVTGPVEAVWELAAPLGLGHGACGGRRTTPGASLPRSTSRAATSVLIVAVRRSWCPCPESRRRRSLLIRELTGSATR